MKKPFRTLWAILLIIAFLNGCKKEESVDNKKDEEPGSSSHTYQCIIIRSSSSVSPPPVGSVTYDTTYEEIVVSRVSNNTVICWDEIHNLSTDSKSGVYDYTGHCCGSNFSKVTFYDANPDSITTYRVFGGISSSRSYTGTGIKKK